jgi:hypothetical protein
MYEWVLHLFKNPNDPSSNESHFVQIVTATVGNSRLNQSLEISEFTFYQYYSYIPQDIPIDLIWVSSSITQKDTLVSHPKPLIAFRPFPP